ncbi:type II secretion system protein GspD [Vibrio mediterranei]|nr:hypothetical protein [Vibrio mediterranei]
MRRIMCLRLLIINILFLFIVSGCSNTSNVETKADINNVKKQLEQLSSNTNTRKKNNVSFVNDFLFRGEQIALDREVKYQSINVAMFSMYDISLIEATNPIKSKGIRVEVMDNCNFPSEEHKSTINYKGNIVGYLNYLKEIYNYDALFDGKNLRLNKCSVYNAQLPGNTFTSNMNMSVNVVSSSPISGVHNQDDMDSIVSTIESILKGEGDIILSKRTGHIRVTSRPDKIDSVRGFIDRLLKNQEKQTSIDVKIVQYSGDESSVFGLSGKLAYKDNNFSNSITSPNTNTDSPVGEIKGTIVSGKFNGTDILLSSLYGNKNVSITSSINLVGINGSPLPFNVSTKRNYVRSIESEYDKDKNTETKSYEIDSVESGLELLMLPTIDELNNIEMTIMIKQKELLKITKYENIQLPETTENSSFQRMRLQSGDTLVLTGFDENRLNDNRGSTIPGILALGGSIDKNKANRKIAILISPKVI